MSGDGNDGEKSVEANRKAIEFLQSINFKCLSKTIFKDHLAVLSTRDGKTIGELKVSVEETIREEEVCYLVQTNKHWAIDGCPAGSSIVAYISHGMKTLELVQYDYAEVGGKETKKKTVLAYDGAQYIIKKTITKGENVSEIERVYSSSSFIGFISDAATIILERVMCIKEDIPESAVFLTLDTSLNLVQMTYEKLLDEFFQLDGDRVQTVGIERNAKSLFRPVSERTRFLTDGHMVSQEAAGVQYNIKLLKPPKDAESMRQVEDETAPASKDLNWREDMMLHSYYIDRKEELRNDHETYLRHRPELQAMLKDFLQFLLLRKPDDVCAFAANYFGLLSTQETVPSSSEKASEASQ